MFFSLLRRRTVVNNNALMRELGRTTSALVSSSSPTTTALVINRNNFVMEIMTRATAFTATTRASSSTSSTSSTSTSSSSASASASASLDKNNDNEFEVYEDAIKSLTDDDTDRSNSSSYLDTKLFIRTMKAMKFAIIHPKQRGAQIFPLMIPIAISPEGVAYGILIEPLYDRNTKKEILRAKTIVKTTRNNRAIEFVAKDMISFLQRAIAFEEVRAYKQGGSMPIRDAIVNDASDQNNNQNNEQQQLLMIINDTDVLKKLSESKHMLNAYVTQKIGIFPDIVEQLISRHEFQKKDETSALVACEFYQSREEFQNKWARPYAVNARTLRRFENREHEARDAARIALSVAPWYTIGGESSITDSYNSSSDSSSSNITAKEEIFPKLLGANIDEMKKLANLEGSGAKAAKFILEGVGTDIAREHEKNGPEQSEEEKALKHCVDILDYVSWGNEKGYESWDEIRPELSESYAKAGMKRVAAFVKGGE